MGDRIDPMAGWFTIAGKEIEVVPTLQDLISQPRSTQSSAMQPRQGNIFTTDAMASTFAIETASALAISGAVLRNKGTGTGAAYAQFADIPVGGVLTRARIQYNVQAGSQLNFAFLYAEEASPGLLAGISSGVTITDGAWHIDVLDWSALPAIYRVIKADRHYMAQVNAIPAGGSTGGEIQFAWIEFQFTIDS